jgi:hypothetical protein
MVDTPPTVNRTKSICENSLPRSSSQLAQWIAGVSRAGQATVFCCSSSLDFKVSA